MSRPATTPNAARRTALIWTACVTRAAAPKPCRICPRPVTAQAVWTISKRTIAAAASAASRRCPDSRRDEKRSRLDESRFRVNWLVNQHTMARPSNTAERRSQITGALVKVMAKQGYDGASIADVARVAKLTPGLVHYHFKSKQEILLAVLEELVERHLSKLDARLALETDGARAQLSAFIDFHLGLGADADPEALACWILL